MHGEQQTSPLSTKLKLPKRKSSAVLNLHITLHTVHLCLSDCSKFQICMQDLHDLYTAKQMHLYNKDSPPTPLKELLVHVVRKRHLTIHTKLGRGPYLFQISPSYVLHQNALKMS